MPYKEKSSLDLRACLTRSNEKGMPICKILDLLSHYVTCLDSKIPLRKRSFLEQYSTDIRVVTANYIHAVTVNFFIGVSQHMATSNLTGWMYSLQRCS